MRREFMGKLVRLFILLAVAALGVQSTFAQLAVTTATLSGAVTDPSGALVAGASVTLNSSEIGVSRVFTTGPQGTYSFGQLPPATYQLAVKAPGFQQYIQQGITLDAGQSAVQNVTMTVGSATQSITVNAQASLLNTENSNISAQVDSKQIVELPLNLRIIYGLATLNSSVNNQT